MAKLYLYEGAGNEYKELTVKGKLCDALPNINWGEVLILNAGQKVTKDYVPKDDEVIFVRKVPTGIAVASIIIAVVTVTAVAATAITMGILTAKQKEQMEEMEEAQKNARKAGERPDARPFIKGANNQSATGQSFPYIIGRTLMTPYKLCSPHYTIGGNDGYNQYYNICLECGFGELLFHKIMIGNTVIKDFGNGTTPQNSTFIFDRGTYYDSQNLIEIVQGNINEAFNALTDLNKKVICSFIQKEIPYKAGTPNDPNDDNYKAMKEGIKCELPDYTMKAEVCIEFVGLRRFDDGWKGEKATIEPEWAINEKGKEPQWHAFDNPFIHTKGSIDTWNESTGNNFVCNTSSTMRFIARQTFPASLYGKKFLVRCRRTTARYDSDQSTCNFMYVNAYCYDNKKSDTKNLVSADVLEARERKLCCRMGMRLIANNNTQDQLDSISVEVEGLARTWDKATKTWSADKHPTSNLAAWVLEILTSPVHSVSRYKDEELDLQSFGAWAEYCEDEGFFANGVIDKGEKKENIISTLCQNGNATLIYDEITGLMGVAIDNGKGYPVALLNSDNIIDIKSTKKFSRNVDGKRVKFVSAKNDYAIDTAIVMKDGTDYDPYTHTLTETTLKYVTDYEHAYKIAWRQLAIERARPKVVTVRVGAEGTYYPLYSKVLLQHRTLRTGLCNGEVVATTTKSGRIKTVSIKVGANTLTGGVTYGAVIQCFECDSVGILYLKGQLVSGAGGVVTLELTEGVRVSDERVPSVGDFASVGELDGNGDFTLTTSTMTISAIDSDNNGYSLTLVDYNSALYNLAGEIPEYKSNISNRSDSTIAETEKPMQLPDVIDKIVDVANNLPAVTQSAQEAADVVMHGVHFRDKHSISDFTVSIDEILAMLDRDTRSTQDAIEIGDNELRIAFENVEKGLRYQLTINAEGLQSLAQKQETDKAELANQQQINKETLTTLIQQNADNITLTATSLQETVDNTKSELQGDINNTKSELQGDINATNAQLTIVKDGIYSAVEGGGAQGQMSLSLELPAMITQETLTRMNNALDEYKIKYPDVILPPLCGDDGIYGECDLTYTKGGATKSYCTLKSNATQKKVSAIWEALRVTNFLASNIRLRADQISIQGTTLFGDDAGQTNDASQTIIKNGLIRTSLIDAFSLKTQNLILSVKNGNTPVENDDFNNFIASQVIATNADGTKKYREGGFIVSTNYTKEKIEKEINVNKKTYFIEDMTEPYLDDGIGNYKDNDNAWTPYLLTQKNYNIVFVGDGDDVVKHAFLGFTISRKVNSKRTEAYTLGDSTYNKTIWETTHTYTLKIGVTRTITASANFTETSYPVTATSAYGADSAVVTSKSGTHIGLVFTRENAILVSRVQGEGCLIETNGNAHFMKSTEIGGLCNITGGTPNPYGIMDEVFKTPNGKTNIIYPNLIGGFQSSGVSFTPIAACSLWEGTLLRWQNVANVYPCTSADISRPNLVDARWITIELESPARIPFVTHDSKKYLCLLGQFVGSVVGNRTSTGHVDIREASLDCSEFYSFTSDYALVDRFTVAACVSGDWYYFRPGHLFFWTF